MGNNLSAILEFLTSTPGTCVAYLVPGSALALLVILALTRKYDIHDPTRRKHLQIGSLILFLLQIAGLICCLNCRMSQLLSLSACQVLESALTTLTILWMIWTVLEEQNKTFQTGIALVLTGGLLGFLVLSFLNLRLQSLFPSFSSVSMQVLWRLAGLLLALAGLVLFLVRHPDHWVIGFLVLTCLGMGHALELFIPASLVWIQLAQAISLPWLLVLVQRLTGDESLAPVENLPSPMESPDRPVDTKPELVDMLLKINLQENAADRARAAVRALSLSLVADICYLVRTLPDGSHIELAAGYDLIREVHLPTPTLPREDLLHIMDAWADRRVLRLSQAHAEVQDVVTLTMLLKYHRIGNLLAYPLHLPNESASGGIIVFSPYTNKFFNANALRLLDEVQESLAQVVFGQNPIDKVKSDLEQQSELTAILRQTTESLTQVLSEKEAAINTLKTDLQQYKAKYQIEKLESMQQIETLQQEIHALRQQPTPQEGLLRRMEQLTAQIRQLTEERDRLKTTLARAEARIQHLETQTGQTGPTRLSMDNQIISLDSIAANVRVQIAAKLQEKALSLGIINPEGRQMVKTDPELLQTILQGLLENAIAITPPSGDIQLRLNVSLETGMLIAEVTDQGEGLTQDEQVLLFSATESVIPGIGNLPAIRSAIRAIRVLNGKIWLRSVKNTSTTFRVQVPVRIID